MKIAVEGCLHGELQKVYETIKEIEDKEHYKVDLLLCCGDFQATRNVADLKCMAVPDKYKEMGSFYKYYSGELKAPMLTLVIGGNHEASNYLQELPFGGWLCPNIYYLGNCGVIDVANSSGKSILTVGGLSGIFKGRDYLKGRHERTPYSNDTMRSVYHVRNIDTLRLKSMPTKSVDMMLSHDWPRGITRYGNEAQLIRFKRHFADEIETNTLGSPPGMEILEKVLPTYWFAGHLHCKFAAVFEEKTKFLALDKCLPNRRFLQIITHDHGESDGPFKLKYNPKWLCILKSTNHLQRAMPTDKHMPGRGYTADRWDYTPTEDEEKKIHEIFKSGFEVPENFRSTASVFDPQADDRSIGKQLYATHNPEPQTNPQTEELCNILCIDDPLTLIDRSSLESVRLSDLTNQSDTNMTFQVTVNEDEIQLDDDDDSDDQEDKASKVDISEETNNSKSKLSLPPPKNDGDNNDDDGGPQDLFVIDKTGQTGNTVLGFKSKLQLPPPKNIEKDNNSSPKRKAEDDPTSEEKDVKENDDEKQKGITKKVMKRRNIDLYSNNDVDE